ncbi:MAG: efflux transporter outer membrane subunit [Rhizobacter sp.]
MREPAFKIAAAAALSLTLLASGCALVGHDYQAPAAKLDASFIGAGATNINRETVAADIATFWRGFNDAELSALVERSLQANGDIRIAQARLQESRALRTEVDASTLPSVGIEGNAKRSISPPSSVFQSSRSQRTGANFDASFVANWELDFFGVERRAKESAAAQVGASEASLGAVQTSVAAEVARNYLEVRGLQLRHAVTQASLVNQRESLVIAQARVDAGRGTQLDLERALTLTASTEAALPSLLAAIDLGIYRLATLSAQPPADLRARLATPAPLPGLPVTDLSALPMGTPQQWMARRPDVAAAERQLAAATAEIGVAEGELYPSISVSGLLGLASTKLGNLTDSQSRRYSVGAGISWTLLDFGRIRARIAASEARTLQSLASYEQTLATALEETEGSFAQFSRNAQRRESLARAEHSASEASRLARLRYEAGVTDFLAVLDADRELLSARDALAQADTANATSLVAVYRALGGGWTGPVTAPAPVAANAAH